ncbi:MAG: hypothetical protein HYV07_15450 [Deltaproteobacteria bacterium]|nr:hypothetical protein [Deltaproteobacteria bacterium]
MTAPRRNPIIPPSHRPDLWPGTVGARISSRGHIWILALAGCVDAPTLEVTAEPGDVIVIASTDRAELHLVRASNVSVAAGEGTSVLLIAAATFVDEQGRSLNPDMIKGARVVRAGSSDEPGSCRRCLGSPESFPVVVHNGDHCLVPSSAEHLVGPDVRQELTLAWPGECSCGPIPSFSERRGELRGEFVGSRGEPPIRYGGGADGRVLIFGQDQLKVFSSEGELVTAINRVERPLDCTSPLDRTVPDFSRYGEGALFPGKRLLLPRVRPRVAELELWEISGGTMSRVDSLTTQTSAMIVTPTPSGRVLVGLDEVQGNGPALLECRDEGGRLLCDPILGGSVMGQILAPVFFGDDLVAFGDPRDGRTGLMTMRHGENGWGAPSVLDLSEELEPREWIEHVGFGMASTGRRVFMCVASGGIFSAELTRGATTSPSWVEGLHFRALGESSGCEGISSSDHGPALALTDSGSWLELADTAEEILEPTGILGRADWMLAGLASGLVVTRDGSTYLLKPGERTARLLSGGLVPELARAPDDIFGAARRGDTAWLLSSRFARLVRPGSPPDFEVRALDWKGEPHSHVVYGADFDPVRDRFILAGLVGSENGWVAELDPESMTIERRAEIQGRWVVDVSWTLPGRAAVLLSDGQIDEWVEGQIVHPRVAWDDPATAVVEVRPPVESSNCENRRSIDSEASLKATRASGGVSWVVGCNGFAAKVHPGFVERVALSDAPDLTAVTPLCADLAIAGAASGERGQFFALSRGSSVLDVVDDWATDPDELYADTPVELHFGHERLGAQFRSGVEILGLDARVVTADLLSTSVQVEEWIVSGGQAGQIHLARECPAP